MDTSGHQSFNHGAEVEVERWPRIRLGNRPGNMDEQMGLFLTEDVEEIFCRYEQHGGKVLSLAHWSESGELETVRVAGATTARKAFQKLRDMGYCEKLSVSLRIPQEVVDAWREEGE